MEMQRKSSGLNSDGRRLVHQPCASRDRLGFGVLCTGARGGVRGGATVASRLKQRVAARAGTVRCYRSIIPEAFRGERPNRGIPSLQLASI